MTKQFEYFGMHILNHFVPAHCFLLLLFYPDAERVIWMCSEKVCFGLLLGCVTAQYPTIPGQCRQVADNKILLSFIHYLNDTMRFIRILSYRSGIVGETFVEF